MMRGQGEAGLSTNDRVNVQPGASQGILGFHLGVKSNDSLQVILCLGDLGTDRFDRFHRVPMPEQMVDRVGR